MTTPLFDHPFLYAVEVGGWFLSDEEAARLREYLDRGGFLMVDDFHGSVQWEGFMESMRKVYPDRPVVELPVSDEVFHVLYDLIDRPQIPSIYGAMSGRTWSRTASLPTGEESMTRTVVSPWPSIQHGPGGCLGARGRPAVSATAHGAGGIGTPSTTSSIQ
ncbi:MAG: DUF4159 domain-containing protein [Gammaproteobacteria bacterium]